VPFTGTNSYKVFQKILGKDIEFPEYLSINAVDLIDSLIMLDPMERLGTPGSKNDIKSLKNHPFFVGIDWSDITKYNALEVI
jgi:hypothetical protein